jgi:hypothetical protein
MAHSPHWHGGDGTFLGIVDLLEPISGLGLEYDGAYHREISQQTRTIIARRASNAAV